MTAIYDSPTDLRKKSKLAIAARDRWKAKHRKSQYCLKNEKAQKKQLKISRDEWRQKYRESQRLVLELQNRLKTQEELNAKQLQALRIATKVPEEKK